MLPHFRPINEDSSRSRYKTSRPIQPTPAHNFDENYDVSDEETRRNRRLFQAKNRQTLPQSMGSFPFPLRPSPSSTRQATPAGSGGSVHVQISPQTSDNNVAMAKAGSQPVDTQNTDSLFGHNSSAAQQGDTQHQSTRENPDTHLATSKEHTQHQTAPKPADDHQNGTQKQTASKTVHAGRKDGGSGGGPPTMIVLSSREVSSEEISEESSDENAEENSDKGPQTQPTTIGRHQPFGQTAGKAQGVPLTPADIELVKRVKKGYDDVRIAHNKVMAKRDKGIVDAQIAHDEAMALREKEEVAAEDQIGMDNTLTDPEETATAM